MRHIHRLLLISVFLLTALAGSAMAWPPPPGWRYHPPPPGPWYWGPPPVVLPPVYVEPAPPPVVVLPQQAPAPAPAQEVPGYWFYCEESKAYYPYVTTCPGGWKKVPATPPAPPQ